MARTPRSPRSAVSLEELGGGVVAQAGIEVLERLARGLSNAEIAAGEPAMSRLRAPRPLSASAEA